MTCLRCGKELSQGSFFCPHCGLKVSPQNQERLTAGTEEDYRAYLGPQADKYLLKFKQFTASEEDGFALTWHWPAFFFGFWWMLYRKLYIWAMVALALWLVPHLALPAWFVWGAVANYLYYLRAKREIRKFRSQSYPVLSGVTLAEIGGVNRWVWVLAVLFAGLIVGAIILGGVFLYQFLQEFLNWPEYLEV
jgi:Protein of unknown function (DUF2628)